MEFRVLGRLRVLHDGREVDLGAPKQRLLLAVLLARAGDVVSTAALVRALWGPEPPKSAADNAYLYVSRLRRALGEQRLVGGKRRGGYALDVRPDEVDAVRFGELATEGEEALRRGDARLAARLLRQGLGFWHGEPYGDLADEPALRGEITRLTERRLRAIERRVEADLELGRTGELVDELTALVEKYPYREGFAAQLMRVLHRSHRQAEALAVYRRAQAILRAQLGIDPGGELREVLREVLAGGTVPTRRAARGRSVPAQLPADVGDFVGRDEDLAWLTGHVEDGVAVPLMTVSGTAGIGKTALAVHWGHREAHRFPDGQLFVDLRGFGPGLPVEPATALAGFLHALGATPDSVPATVPEASAMYRSMIAGRRMLVLLDNAVDVEQVRPLLPGAGGSVVVVTSRERLTGLVARDGGRRLTLDVLAPATSLRLIEHIVGAEQVRAETDAATSLATLCGHLPLALRISAANILDAGTVGEYVAALGAGTRMSMLAVDRDEHSGVRAAFGYSYAALAPLTRRALRRLGLVAGPDFTPAALAALLEVPEADAADAIAQLVAAHLATPAAPGRFRMHDLLREYARERAFADDEPADRSAAAHRLHGHYVTHTRAAAHALDPVGLRLPLDEPENLDTGEEGARAWFDRELPNLVAAIVSAESGEPVWLLADALRHHFWKQQNATDARAVARAGLTAAQAAGDRFGVAAMRLSLGLAGVTTGGRAESVAAMHAAADEARAIGWRQGEAAALGRLGDAHIDLGELTEAGAYLRAALAINTEIGWIGGQADNHNGLGGVELQQGRPDTAATHYAEALTRYRAAGATGGAAVAIHNLATIDADRGRLPAAAAGYHRAIELYRRVGRVDGEAFALICLAGVQRDTGELDLAGANARAALALLDETDDVYFRPVALHTLGSTERVLGRLDVALAHHTEAVELARRAASRYIEGEILVGLAETHVARGEPDSARRQASAARDIAHADDYQLLEGRAHVVLANACLQESDPAAAAGHARRALALLRASGHRLHEAQALATLSRATTGQESADAGQRAEALLAGCGAAPWVISGPGVSPRVPL